MSDASFKPTHQQRDAISARSGSLLLSAGAGSGKTAVLVERLAAAALLDGVAPARMLAITFTEKAAAELKQRLRRRFATLRRRSLARQAQDATIGTFHGFCAQLLRSDPLVTRIVPSFRILTDGLARRAGEDAFAQAFEQLIALRGESAIDVAAAFGVDRLRSVVLGVYGELRSKGQLHPRLPPFPRAVETGHREDATASQRHLRQPPSPQGTAARPRASDPRLAGEVIGQLLQLFDAAYSARKTARGLLDFDDLELQALALLQREEAFREEAAGRFDLIVVDEFQDTNPRQLALLEAIERENLCVVGDEWQSIYGFRHADVRIFKQRRAELAQTQSALALTGNFRSRPQIVDVVNRVFAPRFGADYMPLQAMREPCDQLAVELLLTDKEGWQAATGESWREAEAKLIAQRVAEIVASGIAQPGEIAVLLRSMKDVSLYERALAERGLPTSAAAGEFWAGEQVADLLAYLRVLANPLDEVAVYEALAGPLVRLSKRSLAILKASAAGLAGERTLVLPAKERIGGMRVQEWERLHAFSERLAEHRDLLARNGIPTIIGLAAGECGYDESLLAGDSGQRALANVRKLVRIAEEFEGLEGRDLRGFLDHVEVLLEAGAEPEALVPGEVSDAVLLSSIHAAKGLEFPVVCVADLGREPRYGSAPSLLLDGTRIGLRLPGAGGLSPESSPAFDALAADRTAAELAEEDRILYVAATRARELLLFSGAARFRSLPEPGPTKAPICWLGRALVADLQARLQSCSVGGSERVCLDGAEPGAEPIVLRLNRPEPVDVRGEEADEELGDVALASPPAALASGRDAPAPPTHASAPPTQVPDSPDQVPSTSPQLPTSTPQALASTPQALASTPQALASTPESVGSALPPVVGETLSATALAALERCGFRYYLESVLAMPEAKQAQRVLQPSQPRRRAQSKPPAKIVGQIVHKALETADFQGPPNDVEVRISDAARALGVELASHQRSEIAALLASLVHTPLGQRIAAAGATAREVPFAFALHADRPLIVGVFDLIAHEDDRRVLVVDYKTSEPLQGEDVARRAQRDFSAQRLIYALAALRHGARQVDVAHWFLHRPAQPAIASFVAADVTRLETELCLRIDRARERGFAVSDQPSRARCLHCPGARDLCSWPLQITVGATRSRRDDDSSRLRSIQDSRPAESSTS